MVVIGCVAAGLALGDLAGQQAHQVTSGETSMHARGSFDVKVTPTPAADSAGGPIGHLVLAKQFHGELDAKSQGQMLGAQAGAEGSGAYVALELVTGTLNGKQGSFLLMHRGTMSRGANYKMDVAVVPESGTGELAAISGTMTIIIEGKTHNYDLEYRLDGGS
ncbi:MAG TPA: DUF3224 domain-containing protein [Gemmatimonadales bacterium]|nr:DUF3224 domain-containing protein [Gemmatimonadales bacterium]